MSFRPFLLSILAAPTVLLWAPAARACSVCGCGDPLLIATDPAAITGRLRLELDTDYLRIDAGTDGQPGSTDRLTQWSYRLNTVYRPLEYLAFTLTVPLVHKSIRTVGGGSDVLTSDLTGLGDVEVGARYSAWRSVNLGVGRVHEVAFTLGSSLPTGAHDAKVADGSLVDPHGQLGTGAWGPFVGLHYRLEQGRWTGYVAASFRWRTEATYLDGSRYRFGNAGLWSVHGQYQPTRRVALDLGVDGRYAAADRATDPSGVVDGAVANTGGTVLSAAPGVYLAVGGPVWLFVRGQLPFWKSLLGAQDVYPSFTAGVQVLVF